MKTAKGIRAFAPGILVQAAPNCNADMIRVGLIASKKTGNAVKRNRAKRRMRALVREVLGDFSLSGWDYVLVARSPLIKKNYASLRLDFIKALSKLNYNQVKG